MPTSAIADSADAEYFPLPLRTFAAGRPPMVDLYRSIDGKHDLCCNAESVFSDVTRWRLLDDNVRHLSIGFRAGVLRAGALALADVMSLPDQQVSAPLKARLVYCALLASAATSTRLVATSVLDAPRLAADAIIDHLLRDPRALVTIVRLMRHDPSLATHSSNVCVYSVGLGRAIGIGRDALRNLSLGALLHDLGMARVPPGIVDKPGPLTPDEWEIVHQHPRWGIEILGEGARGQATIRTIVGQHHERLDGSGYPLGIRKSEIHLLARVVGLVDKYDALTTDRPYRPRMQPFGALRAIQEDMAAQFDRDLFVPLLTMLGPEKA